MIITRFRIQNYKSIVDTGECSLENNLTIFAGKNESGKTSVLEALENFNTNKDIDDDAIPLNREDLFPEITICFMLPKEDLNAYYREFGIKKEVNDSTEICIIKKYPDEYLLDLKSSQILQIDSEKNDKSLKDVVTKITSEYSKIESVHNLHLKQHKFPLFKLNFENFDQLKKDYETYVINFNSGWQNHIPIPNDKVAVSNDLNKIKDLLKDYETFLTKINSKWDYLFFLIPQFIIFKSFEDNIPNEVTLSEIQSNDFINDIKSISNLDIDTILSSDNRKKHKHKDEINVNFNKEYSKYWSQDDTKLKIEWDSEKLFIWIVEENELYKPSQRSKGKQWHISFYTRISARAKSDGSNIILIDEPGMFLHATAQNDIYNRLLESSNTSQILFTTHSPYLIEAQELYRVRLVTKENNTKGTQILNKIHAKADKETLTPILTAIGLGINQGIQNIEKINNIIVEGPTDVLYLNAMSKALNFNNCNFIFGGGASNMGHIGTILNGWGCNVLYLFDNDQGKRDGTKKLINTWRVSPETILNVSESKGTIEDLISREDFQKLVLKNTNETYSESESNSELVKNKKLDKVLLAKKFQSLIEQNKILLSVETIKNFNEVFKMIQNAFDKNKNEVDLIQISKN